MPTDEAIGRSLGNESLEENCVFQEYRRYEQEQSQKGTIYHIHFR